MTSYLEIPIIFISLFLVTFFIYILLVTKGYRSSLKKIIKSKEKRVKGLAIELIKENCDYVHKNERRITKKQINEKFKEDINLIKKYSISKEELKNALGK